MVFGCYHFLLLLLFFRGFCSTLQNENQLEVRIPAIVISQNSKRYNNTYSILTSMGFNVTRQEPLHHTSKILHAKFAIALNNTIKMNKNKTVINNDSIQRKYFSNRLAFYKALETQLKHIEEYAYMPHPLDWIFLFEDDIKLHESFINPKQAMQSIITGMKLATNGLIILGVCNPHWYGAPIIMTDTDSGFGVEYRLSSGFCSHAFGIARWKLISYIKKTKLYKYYISAYDMVLSTYPSLLIGSNLSSPEDIDHIGMFYQNRFKFDTTIY